MNQRLKSPWLWLGVAGLAYNVLTQHFGFSIAPDDWRTAIDLASYALLGVGVYSKHGDTPAQN